MPAEVPLNTILQVDCIDGMKGIPDEAVDLVIADPPYFKTVNQKWDYQWHDQDEYLEWSEKWCREVFRVLRLGGSFYVFGYFRTLAYLVPILEGIGFELRQQIIINKGMRAISGRHTSTYKMFPNVTESILFLYKNPRPFARKLLKDAQKRTGIKAKDINEALGVKSNGGGMWSIYTGNNICEQLPTRENWSVLQDILDFEYPYDKLSITYNAQQGIPDVWDDIDFYEERHQGKRKHPTQKPEKLIDRLIFASSNKGDIVLDPFMGSGTTATCAKRLGRNFYGFEIDGEYIADATERVERATESSLLQRVQD